MSKLTKAFGRGVELALKVTVAPYLLLRIKRTQRYMSSANIPDGFTYTAHTGCCNTKPNTLECIDVGVKYGAQIVEFDLRFDENKEPVLSHDEPVGGEVTLDEAFAKISEIENRTVYMCFSTDLLHSGHIAILKKAKYSGFLTVEYEGSEDCLVGLSRGLSRLKAYIDAQ